MKRGKEEGENHGCTRIDTDEREKGGAAARAALVPRLANTYELRQMPKLWIA